MCLKTINTLCNLLNLQCFLAIIYIKVIETRQMLREGIGEGMAVSYKRL